MSSSAFSKAVMPHITGKSRGDHHAFQAIRETYRTPARRRHADRYTHGVRLTMTGLRGGAR